MSDPKFNMPLIGAAPENDSYWVEGTLPAEPKPLPPSPRTPRHRVSTDNKPWRPGDRS